MSSSIGQAESERFVLAACVSNGAVVDDVGLTLQPEDFGDLRHSAAFQAMRSIVDRGQRVDPSTVLVEWRRLRASNPAIPAEDIELVFGLASLGAVASEAGQHAADVLGYSTLRRLVQVGTGIAAGAQRGQPERASELVAEAQDMLHAAFHRQDPVIGVDAADVADVYAVAMDERAKRPAEERDVVGIRSGLVELDQLTRGWRRGHMYVVGGFSGHGKTALMCHLALEAALRSGLHVIYATLEVRAGDVVERMLASLGGINGEALQCAAMSPQERLRFDAARDRFAAVRDRLTILDTPRLKMRDLEAAIRRHQRKPGAIPLGMVLVDYLQLVRASRYYQSEERAVAEVADEVLAVAGEHNVVSMAAVQLNRDAKMRQDKRPVVSDIRYSSRIEHNATGILMLHVPSAYDSTDRVGQAELILRKHRVGRDGTATVHYDKTCHRWRNLDRRYDQLQMSGRPS